MDAHALLTSQGWRGTGNSLHPTNNAIGLAKPLLVSRKDNTHGVGKKQHKTSDMWWMNAFDKSLQGLDTSKEGVVVQTATAGGLDMVKRGGAKWILEKGGLYGSFVRGESLRGTITPEERGEVEVEVEVVTQVGVVVEMPLEKKRKRDGESKEERRSRKAAKRGSEDELAVKMPFELVEVVDSSVKTKEERKARKEARKIRHAEQLMITATLPLEDVRPTEMVESKEERRARRALKKALSLSMPEEKLPKSAPLETPENKSNEGETKEERRERKRLLKLSKEAAALSVEDMSGNAKKKKRRKEQIS